VHAQGVVHRDIKPDNLLLTEDDVLKIVDFGVSEMFEKASDMMTAKSAGSPAFLPPELCVTKHGNISGKAADIWSMGVSLYCLRFGHIPFERSGVLELYECIKTDEPKIEAKDDPEFCDLMRKLLEKDPIKRITMAEIRVRKDPNLFSSPLTKPRNILGSPKTGLTLYCPRRKIRQISSSHRARSKSITLLRRK
jgi:[calcium/calmodulin-dependent protein kinase] kinase